MKYTVPSIISHQVQLKINHIAPTIEHNSQSPAHDLVRCMAQLINSGVDVSQAVYFATNDLQKEAINE